MAFQLRHNSFLTGVKRAHPTDNSTSATPAREDSPSVDESDLPAFLRQSKSDITAKFEDLGWQQQSRLDHGRAGGDSDSPWIMDSSKEARLRNRYLDIRPWEKCRIRLKVPEGSSNYINASPIKLICSKTGHERRYIATQGPKQTGVDHFWQMIWQETTDVAVIVMLTQLAEGIREKCYQYYPPDSDNPALALTFATETGDPQAATLHLDSNVYDYPTRSSVRKLTLTSDGRSKTVWHLLFLAWADHGVPGGPADRLALLSLLSLSWAKNGGWQPDSSPCIVHCSAGVGRSGTFIALEHLLAELEAGQLDALGGDEDPVCATVNVLREQRMNMVQSEAQFAFLYDMLAEAWRRRRMGQDVFVDGGRTEVGLAMETGDDNDDPDNGEEEKEEEEEEKKKEEAKEEEEEAKEEAKEEEVEDEVKPAAVGDALPLEKLRPSGEPLPKAMRLSNGINSIFMDMHERSLSRQCGEWDKERGQEVAKELTEGKTP